MKEENIILNLNGNVATFVNGKLVDESQFVKVDDILIDGKTVGDIGELVIKDREMLGENGIVLVVAIIDKHTKEILAGPEIVTKGFVYVKDNIDLIKEAESMACEILKNKIRDQIGKYFYQETEGKPIILIMMQEV